MDRSLTLLKAIPGPLRGTWQDQGPLQSSPGAVAPVFRCEIRAWGGGPRRRAPRVVPVPREKEDQEGPQGLCGTRARSGSVAWLLWIPLQGQLLQVTLLS